MINCFAPAACTMPARNKAMRMVAVAVRGLDQMRHLIDDDVLK